MKKYIILVITVIILGLISYQMYNLVKPPKYNLDIRDSNGQRQQATIFAKSVYSDTGNAFSIELQSGWETSISKELEITTIDGTTSIQVPEKSININNLFTISKIPYADISKEKPFLTYESCCSGSRYWYDSIKNIWEAEKFQSGFYDTQGKALPEKKEPQTLKEQGACSIQTTKGDKTYYKLIGTEEQLPSVYHYYFLTDKGYAVTITSLIDVDKKYEELTPGNRPNLQEFEKIKLAFNSLRFLNDAKNIIADCK